MSAFRDYVTSTAFNLSISRRQIDCIWQIKNYGSSWVSLNTARALIDKGLVAREGDAEAFGQRVKLTDAGEAVVPLLQLAGLWSERPAFLDEPAVELPPIEISLKRKQPQEAEAPSTNAP